MRYHRKPDWHLPERAATPEGLYLNRRQIVAGVGAGMGLSAVGGPLLASTDVWRHWPR